MNSPDETNSKIFAQCIDTIRDSTERLRDEEPDLILVYLATLMGMCAKLLQQLIGPSYTKQVLTEIIDNMNKSQH